MAADELAAPTLVIKGSGKLRNGLFLRAVALSADRVAFQVFASRPLRAEDLATIRVTDDVGTRYEMVPLEAGVIDGRATIEFSPSVPNCWSSLQLSQPGWGLHIVSGLDCRTRN